MLKLAFLNIKKPSYWLIEDVIHIGSQMRNQLVIAEENVLPVHATIHRKKDETLWLAPAVAEAVVLLNGSKISESTQLQLDDEIGLAGVSLKLFDPRYRPQEGSTHTPSQLQSLPKWVIRASVDTHLNNKEYAIVESLTVGRDTGADVIIENPNISRLHAMFIIRYHQLWVKDLNSSNGTFVNNERVVDKALVKGDVVRIYQAEFEVIESGDNLRHVETTNATRIQQAVQIDADSDADTDAEITSPMPTLSSALPKKATSGAANTLNSQALNDDTALTSTHIRSANGTVRAVEPAVVKQTVIPRAVTSTTPALTTEYIPPQITVRSGKGIRIWSVLIALLLILLLASVWFIWLR